MNVVHRAWRVYADPADSEAATALKVMIPLEFAAWNYRAFAPESWPVLSGTTLVQVLLWCALCGSYGRETRRGRSARHTRSRSGVRRLW